MYFSCLPPPICPLFITPARVSTVCRLMGDDVRQVTVGCVMRMRPLFTTPYVRCLTPVCTLSVSPLPMSAVYHPNPRVQLFDKDASATYHPVCPLFITRVCVGCLSPICPLFITPNRVPTFHSPQSPYRTHNLITSSLLACVWCHEGHYEGHYKAATQHVGLLRPLQARTASNAPLLAW